MNIESILSNIYGVNSSQSFNGISGGCGCDERAKQIDEIMGFKRMKPLINRGRSRVIDDSDVIAGGSSTLSIEKEEFRREVPSSFIGGRRMKKIKKTQLQQDVESPFYLDNEDVNTFFKEFFFIHRASNPHANSIYVIPSSATLKKMIKEFHDKLKEEQKKNGDTSGIRSSTAAKIASGLYSTHKEYIFDVYPKDLTDNKKYSIPEEWPETSIDGVFQRMNRLKHIYYIALTGGNSKQVSIGFTESEAKSGKHKLTFLARTSRRNCFVFQGDIPLTQTLGSNGAVLTLSGGKSSDILKDTYLNLVKKYKDIDVASYNFIGKVGMAVGLNDVLPYYSADFIHCAMQILADRNKFKNIKLKRSTGKAINQFHKALLAKYSPNNKGIKEDNAKKLFTNIFKENPSTKSYIETIKKTYKNNKQSLAMLKADIACNMLVNCSFGDVNHVDNIIRNMDSFDNGNFGIQYNGSGKYMFGDIVNGILTRNPFHGVKARQYVPIVGNYEDRYCDKDEDEEVFPDDKGEVVVESEPEQTETNEDVVPGVPEEPEVTEEPDVETNEEVSEDDKNDSDFF
jgi:predicted small secreted protein